MLPVRPTKARAVARPPLPYRNTASTGAVPMRRPPPLSSAAATNGSSHEESYFPPQAVPLGPVSTWRRASTAAVGALRKASIGAAITDVFSPQPEQMVEPFSFVSTKTSWRPTVQLALGLLGQAGYTMGSAFIEHVTVDINPPPGVNAGVGAPDPSNGRGMPKWFAPNLGASVTIFGFGIAFGVASAILFLRDGLRINGNKKKAYTYVSAHLAGIVLISLSRTVVDFRKNKTPHTHLVALTLPASLGRGMHWVTIPRSFSNSEVTRGDFARMSFEQRQMLSEALRLTASVFFGLWAGSWAISDYNPLQRELWAILGSLTLNVSAALPNTNLRRADAYRRSQTSLHSPPLSPEFRLNTFSPTPSRPAPLFESIEPLTPGVPYAHPAAAHTII